MEQLIVAMANMAEDKVLELTNQYLEEGKNPVEIFRAYQEGMTEIGNRFHEKIYFLPELIMAGEMMKTGAALIKPHLKGEDSGGGEKIGRVAIATIETDIHDIGKNIVSMMMDLNGFDVLDLGIDVAADTIIEKSKEFNADIIGLSGLLTSSFDPMKKFMDKLESAGLRNEFKVIIGGGQMDQQVCDYVGADAWVIDVVAGMNQCKKWLAN